MILGVYVTLTAIDHKVRPTVLGLAATLTLIHLALGVGVNADLNKHIARVETLNDPRLLAVSSRLFQQEALANFAGAESGSICQRATITTNEILHGYVARPPTHRPRRQTRRRRRCLGETLETDESHPQSSQ